ncbi:hypothetical protein HYZ97_04320 [Candidatus Pacearchaeota archaeon]|nr:hypothetical protein [Candidatus Pacearchaeota archaeon]
MRTLLPELILMQRGFSAQELAKVQAFYDVVQQNIALPVATIVDACAGSGLCSLAFLQRDASHAILIDSRKPKRFQRIADLTVTGSYIYTLNNHLPKFPFPICRNQHYLLQSMPAPSYLIKSLPSD